MHYRKLLYKVHLYIGLLLGSFFLLIALTGSFLVFYPEIDLWLNPQIKAQPVAPKTVSLDAILQTLRVQYPELRNGWRIEIPLQPSLPIFARYLSPDTNSAALFAPLVVSIEPSTLKVTSARIWGDYAVTWVFDLHYQLLWNHAGKTLVVLIGLLLMVDVLLGLYLWFPRSLHALKHAFVFKRKAHAIRVNYDIHKLTGVYGLLLLLVLSSTGVLLGRADWFNPIIKQFSAIDAVDVKPLEKVNARPLPVNVVASIAQSRFPNAELRWVYTPDRPDEAYQFRFYQSSEPGRRFPKTMVWVNPYTGEITHIRNPKKFSAGDTMLAWLHPLHNGEAFGLLGRILAFLGGVVMVVLCWTGLKRTLYKRGLS